MPNCPHSLEIIHQDMRVEISHKASVLFFFTKVHGCAKWKKKLSSLKLHKSSVQAQITPNIKIKFRVKAAITSAFVSLRSDIYREYEEKSAVSNPRQKSTCISLHAFPHFFFSFVLHLLTFVWVWDVFLSSTLDIEQSMASYRDQSSYKRPCCFLARSNLRLKILLWPTKVNKGMPL